MDVKKDNDNLSGDCPRITNRSLRDKTSITYGCNKLHVHNWLQDIVLPNNSEYLNFVEVRLQNSR